ncbi:hypothetical protein [Sorangium sp. So ce128]|uniref:hypothetical protein n=1 Tax=Sorangium sp. So ce128 TaxID=3133281 RepID=UPI003F61E76A
MRTTRSIRGSDHALVQRISHVAYGDDAQDQSLPDGCWDLVFMKRRGRLQVLHTGLITHPVTLGYDTGDEYLSIAFGWPTPAGTTAAAPVRWRR